MDYYEEFGVTRTATPSEIRGSYKRLVRLLHPDRCRDDEARRLAEIQMKRLNGMLEVLTDPVRRAEYGVRLQPPPAEAPKPSPRRRPPLWFWIAVAALTCFGYVLLPHHPTAPPLEFAGPIPAQDAPRQEPAPVAARAPSARSAPRARASPARLPAPDPRDDDAGFAPLPAPQSELHWNSAAVKGGVTMPPAPADHDPIPAVGPPEQPADNAAPSAGWTGDWLYVAGIRKNSTSLYPPEYIELRITEDGSGLHGRYRARYRVRDRAISPAVSFTFDGSPDVEGVIPWTGPGGAYGQVRLQMMPGGMLSVSWAADRMGKELDLVSGRAVLIRKLE